MKQYIDKETGTINSITDEVFESLPDSIKNRKALFEVKEPKVITQNFNKKQDDSAFSIQHNDAGDDNTRSRNNSNTTGEGLDNRSGTNQRTKTSSGDGIQGKPAKKTGKSASRTQKVTK
jgi:hypothetical protein